MIKFAAIAIAFALIPSAALAERIPNSDPAFLQRIQSYLSNKSNGFSQNVSDETKITTGLRLCLSKYQGTTDDDVNAFWADIILGLPESTHREAVDFATALNKAAVVTYCPEFDN